MKYEFELVFTPQQVETIEMGLASGDGQDPNIIIATKMAEIMNRRAADGWEPIAPFGYPILWFRREETE